MSVSYISKTTVTDKLIFNQSVINLPTVRTIQYPNFYEFDVSIVPSNLQPQTANVEIAIYGESGEDTEFRFGGKYFANIADITIESDDLTDAEKELIKSYIAFNNDPRYDPNTKINNSLLRLNLTALKNLDANIFSVKIPYEEKQIDPINQFITIPFLTIDGTNASSSIFPQGIVASIANDTLVLNAGSINVTLPSLEIQKNWGNRTLTVANITYYSDVANRALQFDFSETLSNTLPSITIVPTNVPRLASEGFTHAIGTIGRKRVTTSAYLDAQISTYLYRHGSGNSVDFVDNQYSRRLYFDLKYFIRMPNDTQNAVLFKLQTLATSSTLYTNYLSFGMTVSMDVSGSSMGDRQNLQVKTFGTGGYIDYNFTLGSNCTITINATDRLQNNKQVVLDGFSENLDLTSFCALVRNAIKTQAPELFYNNRQNSDYDPTMPENLWGISFEIPNKFYRFNKIKYLHRQTENPAQRISFTFGTNGTRFLYNEIFTYDSNRNLYFQINGYTLREIYDDFLDKVGAYALDWEWAVPVYTEQEGTISWLDIPMRPTNFLSESFSNMHQTQVEVKLSVANASRPYISYNNSATADYSASSDASIQFLTIGSKTFNGVTYATSKLSGVAAYLTDAINYFLQTTTSSLSNVVGLWTNNTAIQRPTVSCVLNNSSHADLSSTSYLYCQIGTVRRNTLGFTVNGVGYTSLNDVLSPTISQGSTNSGTYSTLFYDGVITTSESISVVDSDSLAALIDKINSSDYGVSTYVVASASQNTSEFLQGTLQTIGIYNLLTASDNRLYMQASGLAPYVKSYNLDAYNTLQSFANQIELDWFSEITVEISSESNEYLDATPNNLDDTPIDNPFIITETAAILNGTVRSTMWVDPPTTEVQINFDITYVQTPDLGNNKGVQVALGGYDVDNDFISYDAPNPFYEPSYNIFTPVVINLQGANTAYLLLRTRSIIASTETYFVRPNCYFAEITYENQQQSITVNSYIPTDPNLLSLWTEDFGTPAVLAIPLQVGNINISIVDSCNLESIEVKIYNTASADAAKYDQIGFLAINKTNRQFSQKESKVGQSFGLVLDNIGSWEVLISPEAVLQENSNGPIIYGNKTYARTIFDLDESYDISVYSVDSFISINNDLYLTPLPNKPQVWILGINPSVKQKLRSLRPINSLTTSQQGCFATIILKIVGRSSQIVGYAKVVVYYDYLCVYDKGFCDFYWNMLDPPKISGVSNAQDIKNLIEIEYETLIDCQKINEVQNNNSRYDVPALVSVRNIPMLQNGRSLLLIKSYFNSVVQNFGLLSTTDLENLQTLNCSPLANNQILLSRLNKEILITNPNDFENSIITDPVQIREGVDNLDRYMRVIPRNRFPATDIINDTDSNEFVIAGFGFEFKNWKYGNYEVKAGLIFNLLYSPNVYTSPALDISYRYYYNLQLT